MVSGVLFFSLLMVISYGLNDDGPAGGNDAVQCFFPCIIFLCFSFCEVGLSYLATDFFKLFLHDGYLKAIKNKLPCLNFGFCASHSLWNRYS